MIEYDVDGALTGFPEHVELYWNAIGTEWNVPIGDPRVTVTAPAAITDLACFAGPQGSRAPCESASGSGSTTAVFTHTALSPRDGLTIVATVPPGAVPATGPVLDERWSFRRAFALTPVTVTSTGCLLALGAGFIVWLVRRERRDRRAAGADGQFPPDTLVPAGTGGDTAPRFGERTGTVAYHPPDGLRPAQVGVLIDQTAGPLDVTATIVDLAVRGYLVIQELPRKHSRI